MSIVGGRDCLRSNYRWESINQEAIIKTCAKINEWKSINCRTGRRSNESIELQPLHTGTSFSGGSKASKGKLKRMSHVRSDDIANDDDHQQPPEKSPSPIGAGLPLLSRLRLLKEKQVRKIQLVSP